MPSNNVKTSGVDAILLVCNFVLGHERRIYLFGNDWPLSADSIDMKISKITFLELIHFAF